MEWWGGLGAGVALGGWERWRETWKAPHVWSSAQAGIAGSSHHTTKVQLRALQLQGGAWEGTWIFWIELNASYRLWTILVSGIKTPKAQEKAVYSSDRERKGEPRWLKNCMKVKADELEMIIRKRRSRQVLQPQWEKLIDLSSSRREEEILLTAKTQKLLLERLTSKGEGGGS